MEECLAQIFFGEIKFFSWLNNWKCCLMRLVSNMQSGNLQMRIASFLKIILFEREADVHNDFLNEDLCRSQSVLLQPSFPFIPDVPSKAS